MIYLSLLGLVSVLALWDAWRRNLQNDREKFERACARMKERDDSYQDDVKETLADAQHLRREFAELTKQLDDAVEKQEEALGTNRAILKTFLDSIADLVKLSEEEKQNLRNRLTARKMDK